MWHSSTYVRHPPTLERMTTSSESGRVFILDKWTEVTQSVTEKQKGSFEKREKQMMTVLHLLSGNL